VVSVALSVTLGALTTNWQRSLALASLLVVVGLSAACSQLVHLRGTGVVRATQVVQIVVSINLADTALVEAAGRSGVRAALVDYVVEQASRARPCAPDSLSTGIVIRALSVEDITSVSFSDAYRISASDRHSGLALAATCPVEELVVGAGHCGLEAVQAVVVGPAEVVHREVAVSNLAERVLTTGGSGRLTELSDRVEVLAVGAVERGRSPLVAAIVRHAQVVAHILFVLSSETDGIHAACRNGRLTETAVLVEILVDSTSARGERVLHGVAFIVRQAEEVRSVFPVNYSKASRICASLGHIADAHSLAFIEVCVERALRERVAAGTIHRVTFEVRCADIVQTIFGVEGDSNASRIGTSGRKLSGTLSCNSVVVLAREAVGQGVHPVETGEVRSALLVV